VSRDHGGLSRSGRDGVHGPAGRDQTRRDPAGEDRTGDERAARAVMIVLRLFRALERVDSELTPQQYRILKLAGAGGERSARLAERLAVAKPTLTAIADGLVAAGYARRDTEAGDRRVVRLCLTAAGHEALGRADAAYGRWLDQVLAETGEPGLVLHALDLLNQAMDDIRSSPGVPLGRRPAVAGPAVAGPA
jgi:DNA-binding MarR family transcriptional regulator